MKRKPPPRDISGNRIAVSFVEPQTNNEQIKVVDLDGQELSTYEEAPAKDGTGNLGDAFVYYSASQARATFLYTTKDGYLGFKIAEPQ